MGWEVLRPSKVGLISPENRILKLYASVSYFPEIFTMDFVTPLLTLLAPHYLV